jgi:hypothetical protein
MHTLIRAHGAVAYREAPFCGRGPYQTKSGPTHYGHYGMRLARQEFQVRIRPGFQTEPKMNFSSRPLPNHVTVSTFEDGNRIVASCKVFAILRESVVSKVGTASKAAGTGLEIVINRVSY